MARPLVAVLLLTWAGSVLLLSELAWFRRPSLVVRLRPYVRAGWRGAPTPGVESLSGLVRPMAESVGGAVARLVGVPEQLATRLRRFHSPLDPGAFRMRQFGLAFAAFGVGALTTLAVRPPVAVAILLLAGAPLLAFLMTEQQVASASSRWQRRVFLELPVVAEQLAMLTTAGFALAPALERLAGRGTGACARDLRRVLVRIEQGLSEAAALREWAELSGVPAVDRLVRVLELNRQASDLGTLLTTEARAIRDEVHRELMETIDRRAQQVWIPVTVATLLPGVIFLAIPFLSALEQFRAL